MYIMWFLPVVTMCVSYHIRGGESADIRIWSIADANQFGDRLEELRIGLKAKRNSVGCAQLFVRVKCDYAVETEQLFSIQTITAIDHARPDAASHNWSRERGMLQQRRCWLLMRTRMTLTLLTAMAIKVRLCRFVNSANVFQYSDSKYWFKHTNPTRYNRFCLTVSLFSHENDTGMRWSVKS